MGEIDEKYLFNANLFNDDTPVEEEAPPPPPVFSEAELAAAKKAGFQEGHAQATQEQKNSQNQAISNTLSQLTKDLRTLFAAEHERAKIYEQESVHLTLHTLEALFPIHAKAHGFDELRQTITHTLDKQRATPAVIVHVAPDMVDGIDKHVQQAIAQYADMACSVSADPQLSGHACRLTWRDGGALYNPKAVAQEVLSILQQTLADDGFTGHDECIKNDAQPYIQDQTDVQKHDIVDTQADDAQKAPAKSSAKRAVPDDREDSKEANSQDLTEKPDE